MRSRCSLVDILGECRALRVECQGESEEGASEEMSERIEKQASREDATCTKIERVNTRVLEESR